MNKFLEDCRELAHKRITNKYKNFKAEISHGIRNMSTFRQLLHGRKYTRRKKAK